MASQRVAMSLIAVVVLGGCALMHDMSPHRRLREAAMDLNDKLRWSPNVTASARIAPQFRAEFVNSRKHWGQRVRIAESEVVNVRYRPEPEEGAKDSESGPQGAAEPQGRSSALVSYRWYDRATMRVHRTTVRQRWKSATGGFVLMDEEVVSGDRRLLSPPDEGGGESRAAHAQSG